MADRPKLPLAGLLLLVAVVNGALVAVSPPSVGLERLLLGSALLWVSVWPAWRYLDGQSGAIPFLPAMAVFYFCCYGAPAFTEVLRVGEQRLDEKVAVEALQLALAGEILMLIGFALPPLRWLPRMRLSVDVGRMANAFLIMGYACVALRFALLRAEVPGGLQQLLGFAATLPAVFGGGLLLVWLRGGLSRTRLVLGALLIVLVLASDFATTSMAPAAMTLATLLFVAMSQRRRIPILFVVMALMVVVPAMGAKADFRREITRHPEAGVVTRLEIFVGLLTGIYAGESHQLARAGTVAQTRIDHLSSLTFVMQKTPAQVPYWGGDTYADFFWSFVPRLLAPDKPQKQLGQEYGHRYRFIDASDRHTSINLEQTVEMYANFGVWGVLVGMFLLGYLYRILYGLLNHEAVGDGGILIAAATFRLLLNIESDFSLVFGGIVQTAVLTWIVLRLMAGRHAQPLTMPA